MEKFQEIKEYINSLTPELYAHCYSKAEIAGYSACIFDIKQKIQEIESPGFIPGY